MILSTTQYVGGGAQAGVSLPWSPQPQCRSQESGHGVTLLRILQSGLHRGENSSLLSSS